MASTREDAGNSVDRPSGLSSYSLLRFHRPMKVLSARGMVTSEAGNCLLLAPNYPQYYHAVSGEWSNDWMHFAGEQVENCIRKYAIPCNVVIAPYNTSFLPVIFEEIANEERFQIEFWEDAVELLMRRLLLKLGRETIRVDMNLTPTEAQHLLSLRALREKIRADLAKDWSVKEMAESVGLSASRFANLYQQFFGISPIEDLLRNRIRYAQYLLSNRTDLVSNIAKKCGYKNANHFSTLFQKRVGCSPSYYQKHALEIASQNKVATRQK